MVIEKTISNCNARLIFDPIPSYKEEWSFNIKNLINNAKVIKNGDKEQNLFQDFFKKIYQEPLLNIFNNSHILDFQVELVSLPNENNLGRCLKFSKLTFFRELTYFLNNKIDSFEKDEEEYENYLVNLLENISKANNEINLLYSEALKIKEEKLNDILLNEISSKYFDVALEDYSSYKNTMEFEDYIQNLYQETCAYEKGLLNLKDFFDKEINIEELYACFDPDIFFLLFAKIILEASDTDDISKDYFLVYYKKIVDKILASDSSYNPEIIFEYPDKKIARYNIHDYFQDYKQLIAKHPTLEKINFNLDEDSEKYKNINLMEKLFKLNNQNNWQFTSENDDVTITDSKIKKRFAYLFNLETLIGTPLKGADDYYAFIYSNGKVVIENINNNLTATYILDIDDFITMSEIDALNLTKYFTKAINFRRIFHSTEANWQKNIIQEINGTYRIEDALEFINSEDNNE